MKRLSPALLVLFSMAFCGCPAREKQPGILVNIELASGLASKCAQLVVRANGAETRSDAVLLSAKMTVTVAVAQGALPSTVSFEAIGFSDESCQARTVPPESSALVSGTFVKNTIIEVKLRLAPEVSGTENCSNGRDDDGDGFVDCRDTDCASKPCTGGDQCLEGKTCQTGTCTGGTAKLCNVPPSQCFLTNGSCQSADGGCAYPVRLGAACDDANACTSADSCIASGVCLGTLKVCRSPPSQCFNAGSCGADGGCEYALAAGASCNDGSNCTIADRCAADGGCGGTQVMCGPKACATAGSACFADGGCDYTPSSAGTPCQGGVCNGASTCVANFTFTPSNFTLSQVPSPPAVATVITCADTIIDTTTSPPAVTSSCPGAGLQFGWVVLPSSDQKAMMLMSFESLTIESGAKVTFVGERSPILVVLGDAQIGGQVTARAGARTCGGANNGTGKNSNAGGGGGGYGAIGAGGGQWSNQPGGAGGSSEGEVTLVPLRGGCSSGLGRMNSGPASGGGAIQISVKGTLTMTGFVGAPGAGGAGGPAAVADFRGGNGGGSGGAVLLEANTLAVGAAGGVTANGGGGGEANDLMTKAGMNGSSGLVNSASQALGGTGMSNGGSGGKGGSAGNAAVAGGDTNDGIGGGGGGGGVGRVRFNTVSGCTVSNGAILSPAPVTTQICM